MKQGKMDKRRAGWMGALLALAAGTAAAEESRWVIDSELTATHDSNVSRAERERDTLNDHNLLAGAGLSAAFEPSFGTALNLRAFLEGEAWSEIDTLNRATAGGQVTGRWAPGQGYRAPVLQLTLTLQTDNYEVRQRDSSVYAAQFSATQRANDRVRVSYGLEATERRSEGTVFDGTQGRVFINGDFEIDPRWSAYTGYSHVRGDTFSSAQLSFCNGAPAADIFGLISASEALESDEAFNETFCGSWIAYRLKAQTHVLTLGLNRAFGHHLSADFSVQGVQVNGQGDNDYQRVLVRAGLLARF
ncbi:MAG: hypothetical protein K0Q68_2500 [Moraxellaceae bacterium]|jgi:hypothetical protein|nr:hypothetical protein [Moraxellaceae bacterium]